MAEVAKSKDLPRGQASLDQRGVEKLARMAEKNPEQANTAADFLESDPKSAIQHLFHLSKRQEAAILNTSDEKLRQRIAPAVQALRSGNLANPQFDQGDMDSSSGLGAETESLAVTVECSCKITF